MAIVMTLWGILSFLFAILLPPLGVFMHNGCSTSLLIDILLTLLGYIQGIVYAVFVIITTPSSCFGEGKL